MITIGYASSVGTSRFRERHLELSQEFRTLGKTGLITSPVGFGTYRVESRVQLQRAALAKAIRMGVNLIDTSANYADGYSEKLVGEVLAGMIEHGVASRDEIIIVSKGGYIQGENYERISKRVAEAMKKDEGGRMKDEKKSESDSSFILPPSSFPPGSELAEVVKYGKGLWHSIHPDFLADQITRSLERMNLETIDVYLLHNPEYFLQWAVKDNMPEDEARQMYDERIRKAFEHLEKEVESGRIKWYGISSNTFARPEEAVDRTSLESVVKHSTPHFAAIQFPMNLYERGGVTEANQDRSTMSVIEYAREHGIGVLINRPLNAISENRLKRLVDYVEREFPPEEDITDLIKDIKLQETEFKEQTLPELNLSPQITEAITKLLGFGTWLEGTRWKDLANVDEWRDLLYTVIKPRIQYVFDLLRPASKTEKDIFTFLDEYAESIDVVIEHITNYYSTHASLISKAIHVKIDEHLPSEYHPLSLSQKAILALRSIEGVSSVLVGMRSEEYVEDVIYGLQAKKLDNAEDFWRRVVV